MEIKFQPQGVCSKQIVIDVEDGIVNNVNLLVDVLVIHKVLEH